MINSTRSAIGGLAMLAATAIGAASVTNAPVIKGIIVENTTPTNKVVKVYATNFDSSMYKNFQLQSSTNLVDWIKVGLNYPVQSNLTNEVMRTINYGSSSPYFNNSFYRIKGENK